MSLKEYFQIGQIAAYMRGGEYLLFVDEAGFRISEHYARENALAGALIELRIDTPRGRIDTYAGDQDRYLELKSAALDAARTHDSEYRRFKKLFAEFERQAAKVPQSVPELQTWLAMRPQLLALQKTAGENYRLLMRDNYRWQRPIAATIVTPYRTARVELEEKQLTYQRLGTCEPVATHSHREYNYQHTYKCADWILTAFRKTYHPIPHDIFYDLHASLLALATMRP